MGGKPEWLPLGEPDDSRVAAMRGLIASIALLGTGQFLVLKTSPPYAQESDCVWVAVVNYGHNLFLIEIPGNDVLAPSVELDAGSRNDLSDMGFVAPSGSMELVGRPDTWQYPFGLHTVVQAAELVVWVQEVVFELPHPILLSEIRGGTVLDDGVEPCLHDVVNHSLNP